MTDDSNNASVRKAAELLVAVAIGRLEAHAAIAEWPDPEQGGALGDALSQLQHFAADEDIRAKDESYAVSTRNRLLKTAQQLHRQSQPMPTEVELDARGEGHRKAVPGMLDTRIDRDMARRGLFLFVAWHLGAVCGGLVASGGPLIAVLNPFDVLNPFNVFGLAAGSLLTPLALPLFGLGCLLSIGYLGKRLGHWVCAVVWLLATAAQVMAILHWRSP